jgi:putative ABC transport system permease protein
MAKLQDIFLYAWKNMLSTKLRSYLTVIGIIIGVITMVSITAISEGVQRDINKELSAFGQDKMFISPGSLKGGGARQMMGPVQGVMSGKLFVRDVDMIKGVPGVKSVVKTVYGRTSLEFKGKSLTTSVYGMEDTFFSQWPDYLKLQNGRFYREGEEHVAVLGYKAANEMFGKDKIGVGSVIKIGGQDYRVVGILENIGTAFSASDDNSIYVPYDDGRVLFKDQLAADEINFISIQLSEGASPVEVEDTITRRLAALHRVKYNDPDFTIITADFISNTIGAVIGRLAIFLFFITLIATAVGGIGIMNTMFMGVLERIQEIGLLKAVGATERDILLIFVTESGMMGLVGGIIGLVIGIGIVIIAGALGVPYWLRLRIFGFAFLFSTLIGIGAGLLPARQAAKMDPVDALRYE